MSGFISHQDENVLRQALNATQIVASVSHTMVTKHHGKYTLGDGMVGISQALNIFGDAIKILDSIPMVSEQPQATELLRGINNSVKLLDTRLNSYCSNKVPSLTRTGLHAFRVVTSTFSLGLVAEENANTLLQQTLALKALLGNIAFDRRSTSSSTDAPYSSQN